MPAPIPILHATADDLVVCKPPGLASEHTRDPQADALTSRLRDQGYDAVKLVHRLDSPACGLMIVARTTAAAAHYSSEIAARQWHKVYATEVAIPAARAQALVGAHKAYLATEGRHALVVHAGGKPSFLTIVHAADAPAAPGRSHLLVQLHTGRFHQIRVMLANLGAPLVGDTLYGGPADGTFYLEQVLLGARMYGADGPTVWRAPMHADRPAWDQAFTAAVAAQAAVVAGAP